MRALRSVRLRGNARKLMLVSISSPPIAFAIMQLTVRQNFEHTEVPHERLIGT